MRQISIQTLDYNMATPRNNKRFPTVSEKLMIHVRWTGHVGWDTNSWCDQLTELSTRPNGLLLVPLLHVVTRWLRLLPTNLQRRSENTPPKL